MKVPYPVLCKNCHKELTLDFSGICDKCFIALEHKQKIKCPNCNSDIDGQVMYLSNDRIVYYKCKCGYIIIDTDSIQKIMSNRDLKKMMDI